MRPTEALVARLSSGGFRSRRASPARFAAIVALSALAGFALLALTLGPPLAALPQIGVAPYAMKLAFALSVALLGAAVAWRTAIPGFPVRRALLALALPFAAVAALAALELASASPAFPGATWLRCLAAIGLLAAPAFAVLIWGMRRLAPTRLRLAGAAAGIAAGGIAATAYAPWCPETEALFLAAWYALPIAALGLLGAFAGPRLLRW